LNLSKKIDIFNNNSRKEKKFYRKSRFGVWLCEFIQTIFNLKKKTNTQWSQSVQIIRKKKKNSEIKKSQDKKKKITEKMAKINISTLCMCTVIVISTMFTTQCSGSAIPMWEYLSSGEKVSFRKITYKLYSNRIVMNFFFLYNWWSFVLSEKKKKKK
jgi:hypothetical protein